MKLIWKILVAAATVCLIALLVKSFFFTVPEKDILVTDPASRKSVNDPESSGVFTKNDVAEMGSLSPRDRDIVDVYAQNLRQYRQLKWTALPRTGADAQFKEAVRAAALAKLSEFSVNASTLERASYIRLTDLSDFLSNLLCREAYMEDRAYLDSLGPNVRFAPENIQFLKANQERYFSAVHIPGEGATQEEWARAFKQIGDASRQFRGGASQATDVSLDPSGLSLLLQMTPSGVPYYDRSLALRWRVPIQRRSFLEGGIGKSELLLTSAAPAALPSMNEEVVQCEAFFIVKTRGNDAYAVSYTARWDKGDRKWELIHVGRWCSLRMGNCPGNAY